MFLLAGISTIADVALTRTGERATVGERSLKVSIPPLKRLLDRRTVEIPEGASLVLIWIRFVLRKEEFS